ncbi:MAG TPA: Gfo/Idh/MocA family oxidoreductase, partial [Rectinemataceae bacterium]
LVPGWKAEDAALFSSIDPTWHFFKLQIEDFAASIASGNRPAVTGEDGRETVRIIEGIYRSQAEGMPAG